MDRTTSTAAPDNLERSSNARIVTREISRGVKGADYVGEYRGRGGIVTPQRGRVHPLRTGNDRIPEPILTKIDLGRPRIESV